MKENRLRRNGVQPRPSRPIVGMMICPSMNSTMDSARLRTPRGAVEPSALPAMRKMTEATTTAAMAMSAILLTLGTTSVQRRISLIGGNSSANTFRSYSLRTGGSDAGVSQRDGDVLELPHEESEMRHDDGRSECRK